MKFVDWFFESALHGAKIVVPTIFTLAAIVWLGEHFPNVLVVLLFICFCCLIGTFTKHLR